MDEVALPIVLAWQLRRFEPQLYQEHVKKAADFIAANGPYTPQERWENQSGWSPGTIAAEIAGLVCAADIARRNGDTASAQRWELLADEWEAQVDAWTATSNGPYDPKPYYLRLTKPQQEEPPANPDPNVGTTYSIGDGGPSAADQRSVVDPSFLELVRLGVKPHDHRTVLNTLKVVDEQLGVDTPNGRFWHRFNFDGYGETPTGGPWDLSDPDTFKTIGRIWPIFAGERGEYELLAGDRRAAAGRLGSMAGAANEGWHDPRAGLGREPALRPAGLPTRRGHPLGDAARVVARPVHPPGLVARRGPAGGAAARRGLPLRRLLSEHRVAGPGHAERLEQVQPDLAARREGRDRVEEPLERHLADDGDRRRLQELGDLGAGEGRADDHTPVLVDDQARRAARVVTAVEGRPRRCLGRHVDDADVEAGVARRRRACSRRPPPGDR